MTASEEQKANQVAAAAHGHATGSGAPPRDIARVSEDGLSVELVRYDGAEIVELRAWDPNDALRYAAAICDASAAVIRCRARLGLSVGG